MNKMSLKRKIKIMDST